MDKMDKMNKKNKTLLIIAIIAVVIYLIYRKNQKTDAPTFDGVADAPTFDGVDATMPESTSRDSDPFPADIEPRPDDDTDEEVDDGNMMLPPGTMIQRTTAPRVIKTWSPDHVPSQRY